MSHIHWVTRQNKLETPTEKDEVNKRLSLALVLSIHNKQREVHEYDVRTREPDAMVVPPTHKSTCKSEALVRAPPTIVSSCEGSTALKKWHLPQLCCVSWNPETKRNLEVRRTPGKSPSPVPLVTCQPEYQLVTHHTQITHPPITRIRWTSVRSRFDKCPTDTPAHTSCIHWFFCWGVIYYNR